MTEPSKQLAKDVATELQRRKRRNRVLVLLLLAALIAAAIYFFGFGGGFGFGKGKGAGTGEGSGHAPQPAVTTADAGPQRCTIRVEADGILVNGVKKTRDEAVELCSKTEGAMVTVTGEARQGDWDELRAALQATGTKIYIRGQLWDGKTEVGSAEPGSGAGSAQ